MPRKCLRWMWLHRKTTICLLLVAGFPVLNFVAYNHAHSMTHFRADGSKTGRPESLSFSEKAQVLFLGVNVPRPLNQSDPGSQRLTFNTLHFQGKGGINLEAWHIPHPNAKGTVLLLHGYGACKSRLLPEAKAFHDLGYTTILIDHRGCGGSDGNKTTIGVYEADDVAAVVQSLQKSNPDQPLILYGRSMGAVAILRAISQDGVSPKAAIIECPFDRLLSTVENRFSAMGLPRSPAPVVGLLGRCSAWLQRVQSQPGRVRQAIPRPKR